MQSKRGWPDIRLALSGPAVVVKPAVPRRRTRGGASAPRVQLGLALLAAALASCAPPPPEQRAFLALGTRVELKADAHPQAQAAFIDVEQHLQQRGRDWYPWGQGELYRVNAAIARSEFPIELSPDLAALLRRAARLEVLSQGAFNAGTGRLTELWGLHQPSVAAERPDEVSLRAAAAAASLSAVEWSGDQLLAAPAALVIDPGGLAKGALLDECAALLQAAGVANAIIDLGGDLKVLGQVDGRDARIGIRSPFGDRLLGLLSVAAGESVLSSGNYERYVEIDGQRYSHILDPATGLPTSAAAATVVHRDATLADAAATALIVAGPDRFDEIVESLGLEFALLIGASGDLRLTKALAERLNFDPDK